MTRLRDRLFMLLLLCVVLRLAVELITPALPYMFALLALGVVGRLLFYRSY
jgi:hypothetical protein